MIPQLAFNAYELPKNTTIDSSKDDNNSTSSTSNIKEPDTQECNVLIVTGGFRGVTPEGSVANAMYLLARQVEQQMHQQQHQNAQDIEENTFSENFNINSTNFNATLDASVLGNNCTLSVLLVSDILEQRASLWKHYFETRYE